jgi:hypothetical protein
MAEWKRHDNEWPPAQRNPGGTGDDMPWYRANMEIPVKGHISFRRREAGRHAGRPWDSAPATSFARGRPAGGLVSNQTDYQQNGSLRPHQYPLTWPARGSSEFG